jgi:hypothetical protein
VRRQRTAGPFILPAGSVLLRDPFGISTMMGEFRGGKVAPEPHLWEDLERSFEGNTDLFCHEAIPNAHLGQQVAWTSGVDLQLAAQPGHVDADIVCRISVSWPQTCFSNCGCVSTLPVCWASVISRWYSIGGK